MEVPAVLVGALACPPRTRPNRGFHLITHHEARRTPTLAAFAGLRSATIRGGINAIRQRRIAHTAYLVYSLVPGRRVPYFSLLSTPAAPAPGVR
jgi:hypothetical protein